MDNTNRKGKETTGVESATVDIYIVHIFHPSEIIGFPVLVLKYFQNEIKATPYRIQYGVNQSPRNGLF